METAERFTDRVENYVKYRPSYPPAMLEFFVRELGLKKDSVVVDIGSGTGISSKIFLAHGNTVYGVEPNAAMRRAAENFLAEYNGFQSVDGTSENTTLPADTADFVIAAQAFHWFRPAETQTEFARVLKSDGFAALIWNERLIDANDFLREYEEFLKDYGTDYGRVRHDELPVTVYEQFFPRGYEKVTFPNAQTVDFAGLRGRVLSASYMPKETDAEFPRMEEKLLALFTKYAESDRISLLYDTNVFYGRM